VDRQWIYLSFSFSFEKQSLSILFIQEMVGTLVLDLAPPMLDAMFAVNLACRVFTDSLWLNEVVVRCWDILLWKACLRNPSL